MSLDRLIRLAQRTGDRLIVHDRRGEDVVIMSVDEYEYLLDEVVTGTTDSAAFEDDGDWHRADEVIEHRYHDTIPHEHHDHGRHDRQYQEEDWEEARHPHEVTHHQSAPPAAPPAPSPPPAQDPEPQVPQPVQYQAQEGIEVEQHQEERLDEPVFYEEPV